MRERFREGVMFHALGSHPLFELLKGLPLMGKTPYILQGVVRMYGYIWAACRGNHGRCPTSSSGTCEANSGQRIKTA